MPVFIFWIDTSKPTGITKVASRMKRKKNTSFVIDRDFIHRFQVCQTVRTEPIYRLPGAGNVKTKADISASGTKSVNLDLGEKCTMGTKKCDVEL